MNFPSRRIPPPVFAPPPRDSFDALDEECKKVAREEFEKLKKENLDLRQRVMELEADLSYLREREFREKFPKR